MSTALGEEDRWMQMGLHSETKSGRQYRQVQSKVSGKGIYTEIWNRLSGDLCSSCKNQHHPHPHSSSGKSRLGIAII